MTLSDLKRALGDVIDTGRLGTPVALRIQVELPEISVDLARLIGLFAPVISLVSQSSPGHILARRHRSGKQLSLLWTDSQGRTVSLTVISTPAARQRLRVLLVGNHGITQLNGGEAWDEPISQPETPLWEKEIAESLKRGTSIPVGDS